MQNIGTAERRKRVQVHAYEQVGIVSQNGRQVIVQVVFVPFQRVILLVNKVKTGVFHGKDRRVVAGIINGACQLKQDFPHEMVGGLLILGNGDVHRALDALIFLKLQVCPRLVVQEVGNGRFKGFKHRSIGTLYLRMNHLDRTVELLRKGLWGSKGISKQ